MFERNRVAFRESNARGALLLGALLTSILIVAVLITFRIYTQLDSAAAEQRVLVVAEQQIDSVLQRQLDEEAGLRGFIASDRRLFLEPFDPGAGDFDAALRDLRATLAPLDMPEMPPVLRQLDALHGQWERDVAAPLMRDPHAADGLTRQTLGKVLTDQLRGVARQAHDLVGTRLMGVQDTLKRRINQTLLGGLGSILVFGLVFFVFAASRTQMLETIDRERSIVETLQRAFRSNLDEVPGTRIGTAYLSATRDASVGGDLYDVRLLGPAQALLIVADISGKGIEAAVNTAFVKFGLQMLAMSSQDPAELLSSFNRAFVASIHDPSLFVVAFVAILELGPAPRLHYASAGHAGSFLRRGNEVRLLDVTGPIIGLDAAFTFEKREIELQPGDMLLLATDGLTEARDRAGSQLDTDGAAKLFAAAPHDPQACADMLVAAVRSMSGGEPSDDLALLVLAVESPAADRS